MGIENMGVSTNLLDFMEKIKISLLNMSENRLDRDGIFISHIRSSPMTTF